MSITVTFATLPSGPAVTQYGQRAPITLDSEGLGFPQNYGRSGWGDAHIPRTDRPVRFIPRFQGMTLAIPSLLVPMRTR